MVRLAAITGIFLWELVMAPLATAHQSGIAKQPAKEHREANLYNSAYVDLKVTLIDQRGHDHVVTIPAQKVELIRDAARATICADKDHCTTTDIQYGKSYAIVANPQKKTWDIVESSR
jgi:hypothetical protein